MKNYTETNGIFFPEETTMGVREAITNAYLNRRKVKIYCGDTKTGRCWNEEHDTIGTIGRSSGPTKVSLLIATSRSMGGGEIMTDCIVRVRDFRSGVDLYRAPNYVQSTFEIIALSEHPEYAHEDYTHAVKINGEFYSRHKTERAAKMLVTKMK